MAIRLRWRTSQSSRRIRPRVPGLNVTVAHRVAVSPQRTRYPPRQRHHHRRTHRRALPRSVADGCSAASPEATPSSRSRLRVRCGTRSTAPTTAQASASLTPGRRGFNRLARGASWGTPRPARPGLSVSTWQPSIAATSTRPPKSRSFKTLSPSAWLSGSWT